jgi:HNH endonuclease
VPAALRRALRSRDGGCAFPGCPNQRWVDAHHIRHWAKGGRTALGNLVLLCRRHHRLVHEGGYRLQRDGDGDGGGGVVRILDPRGRELTALPTGRPVSGSPIEERHVRAALGIGPATAMARAGPIENRSDYDLWIGSILGAEGLAHAPPSSAASPSWAADV